MQEILKADQPAYFVLHDGKLQSSAYIKIPAKTLVNVTIINYDGGPADGIAAKYQQVAGTVGNVVYALNSRLYAEFFSTTVVVVCGWSIPLSPRRTVSSLAFLPFFLQ